MRFFKLVVALCLLLALAGAVAIALWSQMHRYLAAPGPAGEATVVVLPRGAGLNAISRHLETHGVIERPWLFRRAVRWLGHDRDLKAGEYAFPARISPSTIIGMIARGETVARRFTVPEGQTVAQVYRALQDTEGLQGELPPMPPEGALLPETYHYAWGDERAMLVRRMRESMQAALDELWPERAPDLPLASRQEALTLASIVDKETGVAAEREVVAAVFVNRLRRGMRLQSDPTVIYGLTGGEGPLGRPLSRADLAAKHPYNTYVHHGLPPGPISNPGREAIHAVLNPAAVDYLFFVADGSGGHAFAVSLDDHNRNVSAWRRFRRQQEAGPRVIAPSPAKPSPGQSSPAEPAAVAPAGGL